MALVEAGGLRAGGKTGPFWMGTLYAKRLERGTFELPRPTTDERKVAIDPAQLAMILEGIDLRARRRLRYHRKQAR